MEEKTKRDLLFEQWRAESLIDNSDNGSDSDYEEIPAPPAVARCAAAEEAREMRMRAVMKRQSLCVLRTRRGRALLLRI